MVRGSSAILGVDSYKEDGDPSLRDLLQDYLELSQCSLARYCLAIRVITTTNDSTIVEFIIESTRQYVVTYNRYSVYVVSSAVVCVYLYVSVLCVLCLCISPCVWLRLQLI